jgi:acyl-lipid omega-6 desaturase (Delta-12 desaturase)
MIDPLTPEFQASWRKTLARYQSPELNRSLWQLANSVLPFLFLWYLMVRSLEVGYWLTLLLAIPAAGFLIRIFIIFHDCGHGSFFRSKKANRWAGIFTGILTLTPFEEWTHNHAVHHATAGNLDRRGTGDVLTLTVEEFLGLPWWKKVGYRLMRHPLLMFTVGAMVVFVIGHRFPKQDSGRRERKSVLWTNLALAGIYGVLVALIGWKAVLLVQAPILFVGNSIGVWLFYVQHNFEGTYWERQEKWDFVKAGMQGSSFYRLPGILQWFTGNIGYHHIHHLSPRIPNYKLQACHEENAIFQVKPLTLLTSLKSLHLRLWDEEKKQLVGFQILSQVQNQALDGTN